MYTKMATQNPYFIATTSINGFYQLLPTNNWWIFQNNSHSRWLSPAHGQVAAFWKSRQAMTTCGKTNKGTLFHVAKSCLKPSKLIGFERIYMDLYKWI